MCRTPKAKPPTQFNASIVPSAPTPLRAVRNAFPALRAGTTIDRVNPAKNAVVANTVILVLGFVWHARLVFIPNAMRKPSACRAVRVRTTPKVDCMPAHNARLASTATVAWLWRRPAQNAPMGTTKRTRGPPNVCPKQWDGYCSVASTILHAPIPADAPWGRIKTTFDRAHAVCNARRVFPAQVVRPNANPATKVNTECKQKKKSPWVCATNAASINTGRRRKRFVVLIARLGGTNRCWVRNLALI